MRRSKRNIGSVYGSKRDVFGERKQKLCSMPHTKNIALSSTINDKPEELVKACLGQMMPHVWFPLLPCDCYIYDTVNFAMGQEWKLLSPLLEEINVI